MQENSLCPCGSKQVYAQCCQPIHADTKQAIQPVQLMRARYSAHVLKNVDFVIATYHSSCQAALQAEAIAESVDSHWVELDVLDAPTPKNTEEGYVEFKAYFEEDGQRYCLHERSRFIKENKEWRYIDGIMPEENIDPRLNQTIAKTKIGRNDPCLCGSGKKFKKCCG
ncbi:YchJ family metal-binding protein [Vibrio gangliei]|uniref:YchJ family metal-binding protein n=1 Tax=Vibrio gangliei TaxID=2077090 RepID=UPI000D0176D6|nr:YchJ family metal-binding protein [Vibrio gangliei]